MSLYDVLQSCRSEEDVKDAYIKKLQHLTTDTFIPPVQSVPQFEELFDRSRELLFKMALVETIVIPRTIWENANGSSRS